MAVDPGRDKCGVAVCDPSGVLARRVVAISELYHLSRDWVVAYGVQVVVVGNQTGSKHVFDTLQGLAVIIKGVNERDSTLRARWRYFRDHPPRGWRRLLPISLQVPPEAYDDYAAVVLAEAYLASECGGTFK